jgi:hypothetical protein
MGSGLSSISNIDDREAAYKLVATLKAAVARGQIGETDLLNLIKVYKVHRSASTRAFALNVIEQITRGFRATERQLAVVREAVDQISKYTSYSPRYFAGNHTETSTTSRDDNEEWEGERYTNDDGDEVTNGRDRWGDYTANYSKGYTTYGGMGGTISFDHETGEEC